MSHFRKSLFTVFALLMSLSLVQANTIKVPQNYTNIQTAIDQSQNGDTVLVSPGRYYENINFRGKNILVASRYILNKEAEYIKSTIIDGGRSVFADTGSCVLIVSGEDSTATLEGFTITHGTGTLTYWPIHNSQLRDGGGIVIVHSSPTIINNLIIENGITTANLNGGGIGVHNQSNPRIFNNIIDSNKASFGAGISIFEFSNAKVKNNIICGNVGGQNYGGGGMGIDLNNSIQSIENGKRKIIRDDYTGKIECVNTELLQTLLAGGYLPVIAPMAVSEKGEALNVDGDRAAAMVSSALKADVLILLTAVPGLMKNFPDVSTTIQHLTQSQLPDALEAAQGRMKKKVLGAEEALKGGVKRVIIADGRIQNPISNALEGKGTVIQ